MTPWFPHSSFWPRWLRLIEHRIHVGFFKQKSYLIDKWTIEEGEPEIMHGIDVEDELVKIFSAEIQKEIKEMRPTHIWKEQYEKEKNKPEVDVTHRTIE